MMGLMNEPDAGIYELEPTLTGIYVAKIQERTNTELDDSMN
jgi:hypothetical protein